MALFSIRLMMCAWLLVFLLPVDKVDALLTEAQARVSTLMSVWSRASQADFWWGTG
ncbi:hypothetical protein [Candidatus Aquiluna sp. UB-MaderosW2red]|uniref:hypothetical protein n=1 Tax=Candidatus Aquiluna sp. UB-MaderosW2red TaxID=1855377 RepID=UPI0012FA1A4E|nr:hypothetical protein [Candidatus Aquiluna sp. UB-MaderosW2red]